MNMLNLCMIVVAYLFGSISSAVIVCRIAKLPDPRENGSGNPGATNVFRIGGPIAASIVLVCDVLKGMIPSWISYNLNIEPLYLGVIAIAACLGHIYPIFFRFRGGKGVATAFGAIAPMGLGISAVLMATWLMVIIVSGYSSLGAIVTALLAPLYVWYFGLPQLTFPVAMLSCLIILRHHENIQRIWRGQEDRIWKRLNKSTTQKHSK